MPEKANGSSCVDYRPRLVVPTFGINGPGRVAGAPSVMPCLDRASGVAATTYSDYMRLANPLALRPMRLLRIPEAFDHPDFLYEVKFDGFGALAHVDGGNA